MVETPTEITRQNIGGVALGGFRTARKGIIDVEAIGKPLVKGLSLFLKASADNKVGDFSFNLQKEINKKSVSLGKHELTLYRDTQIAAAIKSEKLTSSEGRAVQKGVTPKFSFTRTTDPITGDIRVTDDQQNIVKIIPNPKSDSAQKVGDFEEGFDNFVNHSARVTSTYPGTDSSLENLMVNPVVDPERRDSLKFAAMGVTRKISKLIMDIKDSGYDFSLRIGSESSLLDRGAFGKVALGSFRLSIGSIASDLQRMNIFAQNDIKGPAGNAIISVFQAFKTETLNLFAEPYVRAAYGGDVDEIIKTFDDIEADIRLNADDALRLSDTATDVKRFDSFAKSSTARYELRIAAVKAGLSDEAIRVMATSDVISALSKLQTEAEAAGDTATAGDISRQLLDIGTGLALTSAIETIEAANKPGARVDGNKLALAIALARKSIILKSDSAKFRRAKLAFETLKKQEFINKVPTVRAALDGLLDKVFTKEAEALSRVLTNQLKPITNQAR